MHFFKNTTRNRILYSVVFLLLAAFVVVIIVVNSKGSKRDSNTDDSSGGVGSFGAAYVDGDELNFETIEHGYYSGIKESGSQVFRSSSKFEVFWNRHVMGISPKPSLPNVDFTNSMIVNVMRGEKNSGGYGIEIKSIVETDSEIVVLSETTDPCSYCAVTQVLTQPFHVVETQASVKPVRFRNSAAVDPPPYPLFILSYNDEVKEPYSEAANIKKHESVKDVEVLSSLQMMYVHFYEDKVPCAAKEILLEIVGNMDHFEYLEADPLEENWGPC